MKINVKCEICGYVLGKTDTNKLKIPIDGSMFESKNPGQYPEPFHPACEWLWLRCPMCNKRPFMSDKFVISESGKVICAILDEPEEEPKKEESASGKRKPAK